MRKTDKYEEVLIEDEMNEVFFYKGKRLIHSKAFRQFSQESDYKTDLGILVKRAT